MGDSIVCGEAQVDCLVMSEMSLERTSRDPRMQGRSPVLGAW
jgi:hypothetical protein